MRPFRPGIKILQINIVSPMSHKLKSDWPRSGTKRSFDLECIKHASNGRVSFRCNVKTTPPMVKTSKTVRAKYYDDTPMFLLFHVYEFTETCIFNCAGPWRCMDVAFFSACVTWKRVVYCSSCRSSVLVLLKSKLNVFRFL